MSPHPFNSRILHALFTLALSPCTPLRLPPFWLFSLYVYRFSNCIIAVTRAIIWFPSPSSVFTQLTFWMKPSFHFPLDHPRLSNPLRIRRTHFDILTIIFCASLLHFSKRIRIACSIFNNTLCAFWLLLVLFSLLWTRTGTHTHAQCDKCASKMCLLTVFVVMSHPLLYTYSGHCNFDTAFKYNVLFIFDHVHRVNLV